MRTRILRFIACAFLSIAAATAGPVAAASLPGDFRSDLDAFRLCRDGLARTVAFAASRSDIFGPGKKGANGLPDRQARMVAWGAWSAMLDYTAALDGIGEKYEGFNLVSGAAGKRASFSLMYASFLAEYRFAMEFIALAEKCPAMDKLLNEPVPEFGIPAGRYSRFKFRFLNVARATEFAALQAVDKGLPGTDAGGLRPVLEEDSAAVWRMGRGKGPVLTFANGLAVVGKAGFAAWFPLQKGASEFMGDVKVRHIGKSFISPEQIRLLPSRLAPGDILLERREWYLSNLGLPGFWTHAALYVGTAAERRAVFNDPAVQAWVRSRGEASGDFEKLLRASYPGAYGKSREPDRGHSPRVLEAVSEGVIFTTLEHSAAADSLAVLRPRLSGVELAEAVLRAFHYSGRPYDFNFDFTTDSSLVCSELIYKVYEPAPGMRGLRFPLTEVMGRPVSTPNGMARQFSEQYGTPAQQTDFVLFLDGSEKTDSASEAGLDEFRRSWQRPKWHILARKPSDGRQVAKAAESRRPSHD